MICLYSKCSDISKICCNLCTRHIVADQISSYALGMASAASLFFVSPLHESACVSGLVQPSMNLLHCTTWHPRQRNCTVNCGARKLTHQKKHLESGSLIMLPSGNCSMKTCDMVLFHFPGVEPCDQRRRKTTPGPSAGRA